MTAQATAAAPQVPVTRLDNTDLALREQMLAAIARVAESGAFSLGEEVDAFEREFADYCEVPHAVGVSSGTEALVLALRALGVGPGDEVIVPANSFIATAEAVSLVGAAPRLVDVDPDSHLLTGDAVRDAITERTRCVIPVHLMGSTVDLGPILEVGRSADIRVIEDAAQAHGARVAGRRAGSIGDLGCFSFYPTKNLGGWGDGGAVVTADAELADRVRLLRCHGERPRYHHRMVGTTARLDAVQATVLRIKLARLESVNAERRRLGSELGARLAGTSLELPTASGPAADHVFHLFVARSDARDDLRGHLAGLGVATAVHYPVPIHLTEAYAGLGLRRGSLPVAEDLARRIVTLPLFPGMSDEEVGRVVDAVRDFDERC